MRKLSLNECQEATGGVNCEHGLQDIDDNAMPIFIVLMIIIGMPDVQFTTVDLDDITTQMDVMFQN